MAINKGKIIVVTSMKGGTGKTTTTLNLAGIYQNMGKKVLILDADLYGSAIAASLNVNYENDLYNLVDDFTNNRFDNIDHYVTKYTDFIDVLAAPKDPRSASKITVQYMEAILTRASMKYDILLIDTNDCMDQMKLLLLDHCDEAVFVMTNDPIDIKNMKSIVSIYKNLEKTNYRIVLNTAIDHNRSYFDRYDIKNTIHDNIDYTIPSSFHIRTIDKYVLDGKILTLDTKLMKKHKQAMKNYELLAKTLIREKK